MVSKKTTSTDYRFVYHSSRLDSAIHTKSLNDLVPTMIENLAHPCFWIDIKNPTFSEMETLQDIFYIHPLTVEDIMTNEPREKCEAFNNYYFINFKSFDSEPYSTTYLQPVGLYILLFQGFVISVRKKVEKSSYVLLTLTYSSILVHYLILPM